MKSYRSPLKNEVSLTTLSILRCISRILSLVMEVVKLSIFPSAVEILDSGSWLLGNFATVDEVKKGLKDVIMWGAKNPVLGGVPPIKMNGFTLSSTGHGAGLHGLPGDPTPPSRFIRTVLNTQLALPAKNASDAVNLAEHVLNAVDITEGVNRINSHTTEGDHAQWALMKDITNRVIYYRSYNDLSIKAIDLRKIDLTPDAPSRSISIIGKTGTFTDVTAQMK